jgi:hypothetical protein
VEISAVCRIEVRGVSTADLTSPRLWSTFGNSNTSAKTPREDREPGAPGDGEPTDLIGLLNDRFEVVSLSL